MLEPTNWFENIANDADFYLNDHGVAMFEEMLGDLRDKCSVQFIGQDVDDCRAEIDYMLETDLINGGLAGMNSTDQENFERGNTCRAIANIIDEQCGKNGGSF